MRISPEKLNEVVPRFMRDGWQVVSIPLCRLLKFFVAALNVGIIRSLRFLAERPCYR